MGKVTRTTRRHGGAGAGGDGSAGSPAAQAKPQHPLAKELLSSDAAQRAHACVALAAMFGESTAGDDARVLPLLRNGVLDALSSIVVDVDEQVRGHGLGAILNMALAGGEAVSRVFVGFKLLTSLTTTAQQLSAAAALSPAQAQILATAWAVCSTFCQHVPEAVPQCSTLPIFVAVGQSLQDSKPLPVQQKAAQFCHVIAEDNDALASVIAAVPGGFWEWLSGFINSERDPTVRLHLSAMAVHLTVPDALVDPVVALIAASLAGDAATSLGPVDEALAHAARAEATRMDLVLGAGGDGEGHDDTKDEAVEAPKGSKAEQVEAAYQAAQQASDVAVQAWRNQVAVQQLALEVLALACSSADGEEGMWTDEELSKLEEAGDDAVGATASDTPLTRLMASVASAGLVAKATTVLTSSAQALANPALYQMPPSFVSDMKQLAENAFGALVNMLHSLPIETWGGDLASIFQFACTLCRTLGGLSAPQEVRDSLIGYCASMLHAIVFRAFMQHTPILPTTDQFNVLIALSASTDAAARERAVAILGIVGQAPHDPLLTNALIGKTLARALTDSCIPVVCEALNSLFDVYKDETYDETFAKIGLLALCQTCQRDLERKLAAERSSMEPQELSRAQEAKGNLVRFLRYKRQHLK